LGANTQQRTTERPRLGTGAFRLCNPNRRLCHRPPCFKGMSVPVLGRVNAGLCLLPY